MWRISCCFLLLPLGIHAQAGPRPARAAEQKRELTELYTKVLHAVQSRDTVTLRSIYAEDYTFAIGGGDSVTTLSRAERLQSVAANPDSIRTLNLENCDFGLYVTWAMGRCWVRQGTSTTSQGEWVGLYTTVIFAKDARARWRMVASHVSVNRLKRIR
jgi:ketosteroid isomerase-like protein